jgi:hypothetical protein
MQHTPKTDDGSPKVTYEELFGTPPLSDTEEPAEPEDPPEPPPIYGVSRPVEEAFRQLWPVAYRHHENLMEVMSGVRKALKRGHDAAERAGGPSR